MNRPAFLSILASCLAALVAVGCSGGDSGSGRHARSETLEGTSYEARGAAPGEPAPESDARARNVILLIADGMGFAHINAVRTTERGVDAPLAFERAPVVGWHTTHAADRWITDSAASASAMATGQKVRDKALSVDADDRPLPTLAEAAIERGIAVGLITDSYLWDATPAAFLSHVDKRKEYQQIVDQLAGSGALFLAGSAEKPGTPADEQPARLAEAFSDSGWDVYDDWLQLSQRDFQPGGRLVGLFPGEIIADDATLPRLEQLAELAIRRLAIEENGFFLLVETEEVDSGAHDSDFERVRGGVLALERLFESAMSFARADGETLVVVTSDHESGGLALVRGRPGEPLKIRWATKNHTAEPVPIYAYGPGAERFGGVRDNTDIFGGISAALGLTD